MQSILNGVSWVSTNGPAVVAALNGLLAAAIAVALLIPGEQPEKALKGLADFLSKFSKK